MKKLLIGFLAAGLFFSACVSSTSENEGQTKSQSKEQTQNATKANQSTNKPNPQTNVISTKSKDSGLRVFADGSMSRNGIKLTPVKNSPGFEDATLKLVQPEDGARLNSAARFEYNIENFNLGNQTPDASDKMCANSKQGQHIHSILNNEPYTAYYRNKFSRNLGEGYYIHLAFLSRSYHESIKTPNAFQLSEFSVGDGKQKLNFDSEAPNLFYSRPKGNYIGPGNIEKILLDFYLINTELSARGNKVKLSVNGTEFILTKWQPYYLEGLKLGANTIALELIDARGKKLPGPFNFVQRNIFLYEDEPIIEN